MAHGKKYNEVKKTIDATKIYSIADAVDLIKKTSTTKFDSTVEIAVKTNANPKYNDQMIRATMIPPHGTGKSKRIAVFVSDDKADEAKKAWADVVGFELLLADIKAGKFDFDILITSPDHIRDLAPVAKQLGPKGLMPSPKSWTITPNVPQAVEEFKKGKIELKLDKTWNIHSSIGKASFDAKSLQENIESFLKSIEDNKPAWVKGKLVKKVVISTTMGPGVQIEA